MSKLKKATNKEKAEVLDALMHRLNFHRTISMNEKAVDAIVAAMVAWSEAHQFPNESTQDRVNSAFEKLKLFL